MKIFHTLLKIIYLLMCIPHITSCSDRSNNQTDQSNENHYSPLRDKFTSLKNSSNFSESSSDDEPELQAPIDPDHVDELSPEDLVISQQQRILHNSGQDFSDDDLELDETTTSCPTNNLRNFFARCCLCFGTK